MDGGGGGGGGALWWWWCLCGVVGFSLFLLVNLVYLLYPTWKLRHVPCPPYLWGIGHLPLMVKEQAQVFVRLAQEYGPIYRCTVTCPCVSMGVYVCVFFFPLLLYISLSHLGFLACCLQLAPERKNLKNLDLGSDEH